MHGVSSLSARPICYRFKYVIFVSKPDTSIDIFGFLFVKRKMSIDILLSETEALPLPMDVLHKMAGKGDACKVITYDDIARAHKLSDILNEKHPYAIVLVMDKKKGGSVGHYVAIWLTGKKEVSFFDAYAHRVKALLDLMGNSDALIRLVHAAGRTLSPNKK
jgi:hypothetical protein